MNDLKSISAVQVFLAGFFVLGFGAVFALESAFGRPLTPPPRIASRSAFVYIPAEPMYLKGSTPFRLSLILTAVEEISSCCAISNTVIPSIPINISANDPVNQGKIAKMLQHCHLLLYTCIAKTLKICKFLKISSPAIDNPLGRGILFICYIIVTIKKTATGSTGCRRRLKMKLDVTFANEVKKAGNGDGSREYKFAFDKELKEISSALERRYEFENCLKKYGRAKVALCVAATISKNVWRYEAPQIEWADHVMSLWTNKSEGSISAARINIHPAILADNSRRLQKAVTI